MKRIIHQKKPIEFNCICWCVFESDDYVVDAIERIKGSMPSPYRARYIDTCPVCHEKIVELE